MPNKAFPNIFLSEQLNYTDVSDIHKSLTALLLHYYLSATYTAWYYAQGVDLKTSKNGAPG